MLTDRGKHLLGVILCWIGTFRGLCGLAIGFLLIKKGEWKTWALLLQYVYVCAVEGRRQPPSSFAPGK